MVKKKTHFGLNGDKRSIDEKVSYGAWRNPLRILLYRTLSILSNSTLTSYVLVALEQIYLGRL